MQRSKTRRKNVPCECSQCGGIKHVSQEERRSHLKRDKLLVDALLTAHCDGATSSTPAVNPAPVNNQPHQPSIQLDNDFPNGPLTPPSFSCENPHVSTPAPPPFGSNGPLTPPSFSCENPRVSTPPPPPPFGSTAFPPGTPVSERRAASLRAQERRAEFLMAEALLEVFEENDVPLMDDNWEEPDVAGDDTEGNEADPHPGNLPNVLLEPQPPQDTTLQDPLATFDIPVARGVPRSKLVENEPDPFVQDDASTVGVVDPTIIPADIHPQSGVYMLYMLVTWLHLQFHVPFRACTAIVGVFTLIIQAFGNTIQPPALTTLPRIMAKLQVEPEFTILPVCPNCLEVFPNREATPDICPCCLTFIFKATPINASSRTRERVPLLRYPSKSITSQLESLLAVPGIEEKLDEWRRVQRRAGEYIDVFDGRIPQNLKGPNGDRFFRNDSEDRTSGPDGELRIALTLGVDWFSYLRSQIAPSHTSCPMSFNVANLPPYLRYRTANLLLAGIMPGSKEQDPDQCQRFFRIIVNELLRLWEDGVVIKTPSCPEGRLVRLILIAICCDKPAAHKMGGFGSHSHTFFCTRCWIKQSDKGTANAFKKDAFRERTDVEHRNAGERYAGCQTNAAREEFVRLNAARWSEFARLPYFDLVKMIVIDPMHNLLLGLVKTHFYHIWVQGKILRKTKELRALHNILSDFSMPAYLGRLPSLMGIPAGGSLTADQWLLMATVVAPIAIPQIWHDYMLDPDEARAQRKTANDLRISKKLRAAELKSKKAAAKRAAKAQAKAAAKAGTSARTVLPEPAPTPDVFSSTEPAQAESTEPEAGSSKRKRKLKAGENGSDDEDDDLPSCLHPDDPGNFLKLCRALRILVSRRVTDEEIEEADQLLREYCAELIELYGPDVIRPNHHYATHTPESIRDYGPFHGFWTFLFERLNKVLKSYKTNNHGGGELETTFFREFHRTVLTSRLVARSAMPGSPAIYGNMAKIMFDASADDRGTVQALARELDEVNEDDGIVFSLSPRYEQKVLNGPSYTLLLRYLSHLFPHLNLRSHIEANPLPHTTPLHNKAHFFDYAIVKQHRYYASNRSSSNTNSLVEVIVSERGDTWVGELTDLIHINQSEGYVFTLGQFRWFRPLRMDLRQTVWSAFEPIGVQLWHDGQFLTEADAGPPPLLPLQYLRNPVARHDITVSDVHAWATIRVEKK